MNIVLQDENQTLTDQQIDKTMDSIIRRLENELGAIIRR
jgi:phenylalanyl-tRNA synthetase beta subunit